MTFVVTGAAGMLGHDVVERLRTAGATVHALTRADLDVTDDDAVHAMCTSLRPRWIINCAAFTAVDACESDSVTAYAGNQIGPRNLARGCETIGARLVHISTDYVFDGTKPTPYHEADPPNPASVYGASKLAGEHAVFEALGDDHALVIRTSWVCGLNGHNMVKTVLKLAANPGPLRFVSDQRGCPTFTEDLAAAIELLTSNDTTGLFHVTNQGPVSWFEFVQEILHAIGQPIARVEPVLTCDLQPPRPAPRPANSVLENRALAAAGYTLLDDFRVPLARLIAQLPH